MAFSDLARYFDNVGCMIREVIDMIPFRSLAEETMNCWLSYTMSMPVSFDLSVIFLFLIQYLGFRQLRDFFAYRAMHAIPQSEAVNLDFLDPQEVTSKM